MSLTYNVKCLLFEHNLFLPLENMKETTKARCKNCKGEVDLLANTETDNLTETRIEMKRALRELFLLNHRRNLKRKALNVA